MSGIGRRQFLSFTEIPISVVLGLSVSTFYGFVHKCYGLGNYSSDAEEAVEGTKSDLVLHDTRLLTKLGVEELRLI